MPYVYSQQEEQMITSKATIKIKSVRHFLAGLAGMKLDASTAYELAEMLRVARLGIIKKARGGSNEPPNNNV